MKKHPVAAPDWEDKYHSLGFVAQKGILAAPDWEDKDIRHKKFQNEIFM